VYWLSSATSRSPRPPHPRPRERTVTEIEIRADTRTRSERNDARDATRNWAMTNCAPGHTRAQAVGSTRDRGNGGVARAIRLTALSS
jgi:hypothetical protein